jgi:G3E family GTPase
MTATTLPLTPVTILCGFLGVGKTTLLLHLLGQAEGRRWAAVVNDLASVNIDGALVRSATGVGEMVEIGNGCVCCSSKDELAETIVKLALTGRPGGPEGRPFDHIIVETTGVAEPRGIANLFLRKNPFGRSLADFATLSALVTVVDARALLEQWEDRPLRRVVAGTERPVVELLLDQVEVADVVVINQCDRINDRERARIEAVLEGLNARAERVGTEHGQVASEFLLGRVRFDPSATLGGARWIGTLNAVAPIAGRSLVSRIPASAARPEHERKYGIRSFVYQARRPFDRVALTRVLASGLPGLLRAKGFFWDASQPDEMGLVSVAGGVVRIEFLSYWWAALVESGKARREDRPPMICALWEEPGGDRRQEIALIGIGLDEASARTALDGCLV